MKSRWILCGPMGFPQGSVAKKKIHLPTQKTWVRSLFQEEPLEKAMATYSSILAWEIPRTEEPGGPQSMGSQRVEQDWMTKEQWVNNWCPYKKKREFRETQIRGWCEEWGDWSDTSTSKETPSNVRSCRSSEEARKDSHLEASKGVWSSWWLDFRHLASRTGEETGNPLQYSCLENPMDRGAW